MKRQEKRRRKLQKQRKEARMIRLVTAKLLGVHPSEAGEIRGHRFITRDALIKSIPQQIGAAIAKGLMK